MKTTQAEAANMNVHQVADVKATEVIVVVDNTDSASLLLPGVIPTLICLVGFANSYSHVVHDINATVD